MALREPEPGLREKDGLLKRKRKGGQRGKTSAPHPKGSFDFVITRGVYMPVQH